MDLSKFIELADLFEKHGFKLYLVGGSSRDYLLNRDFTDLDLATDALPSEMKLFLKDADYHFERFGNVHMHHIDITTFRIEQDYHDFRHPFYIKFTRDIKEDYKRRDLTINALYIDKNLKVYDFVDGLFDLENKIIRFIGDPIKRVQEDPLRILRAERFAKQLNFKIEAKSYQAMVDNRKLIEKINTSKIKQELMKL